jgi:hypothetical protein
LRQRLVHRQDVAVATGSLAALGKKKRFHGRFQLE